VILTGFKYWGEFGLTDEHSVICINAKYSNFQIGKSYKIFSAEKNPKAKIAHAITEFVIFDEDSSVFACPYEHEFIIETVATRILYGI